MTCILFWYINQIFGNLHIWCVQLDVPLLELWWTPIKSVLEYLCCDGLASCSLFVLNLHYIQVEQLHRIFKLCGCPSEDYWRKLKLSTNFRPPPVYKPSILLESFRVLPASSLSLLTTLLALDPTHRGTAASALQNEVTSYHDLLAHQVAFFD